MLRNIVLLLATAALLSLSHARETRGEDAVLNQLYGSGVHAYYSKDYRKAHQQLSTAIKAGSRDPRCYYFRGLAYLKLGREAEGKMDFQKGAELESNDQDSLYNVARSLERVQGTARITMEDYRVKARMAVLERAERIRRIRYEEMEREEGRVLRVDPDKPAEIPLDMPAEEPAGDDENPFGMDTPAEEPADVPATDAAEPAEGGILKALGGSLGKALADDSEETGDSQPVDVPDDDSFLPPTDEPIDEPVDAPAVDLDASFGGGAPAPADVPIDEPSDLPVDEPADEPADEPVDATEVDLGDPFGF